MLGMPTPLLERCLANSNCPLRRMHEKVGRGDCTLRCAISYRIKVVLHECFSPAPREVVASIYTCAFLVGGLPCCLVGYRYRCRGNARGLRNSSFARLREPRGITASGRYIRVFAGWDRLRAARLIAPIGGRADFGDLSHGRRVGRPDGGSRRATLRANRQSRGIHCRPALRDERGGATI